MADDQPNGGIRPTDERGTPPSDTHPWERSPLPEAPVEHAPSTAPLNLAHRLTSPIVSNGRSVARPAS